MTPSDVAYFNDLTVHLRLAGLSGDEIGAVIEEAKDHLALSGETPEKAFGPAEGYARQVARSRGAVASRLTLSDLLFGALLIAGCWGLLAGLFALASSRPVTLRPGHVLGLGIVFAGLAWPVWAAFEAFLRGRVGVARPAAAMTLVIALVVAAAAWKEPVLASVPALAVVLASAVVMALSGFWARRLRKPIRRPTSS